MKVSLDVKIENRNELNELLEAIEKNTTDLKNNLTEIENFEFEVSLVEQPRRSENI